MTTVLRHPATGRVKALQDGWSWACFLGSGFFGLPLFMRGLPLWGAAMAIFSTVSLTTAFASTGAVLPLGNWLTVAGFGLSLYFGMNANRMAIARHLKNGWVRLDASRGPFGDML